MLTLDVSAARVVDRKCELVELLGLGSMGEVWRAHHIGLNQECAVKLIARETHEAPDAALHRFTREARIAAALSRMTRHIVSVTDFGNDAGGAYLVMDLLAGEPLDARMSRPCTPEEVSAIVAQIAKGLGVAHREGILHRDLKPANVFLSRTEEGALLVKLLDFGIARLLIESKGLTVNGVIVGSPAYMSPEHALGEPLDARADVWSLAVVAYEALTGVLPFNAATTEGTLERIISIELTPLRDALPNATPSLEAFFTRAFARRIEDRFQTASELASAFAAAVASRSIAAAATTRAPFLSLSAVHRDRVRLAAIGAVCSAAICAGALLVSRSSSSSVPRVAQTHVEVAATVAPAEAMPIETRIETSPPPPLVQAKAKPLEKPKPKPSASVDPSSIF